MFKVFIVHRREQVSRLVSFIVQALYVAQERHAALYVKLNFITLLIICILTPVNADSLIGYRWQPVSGTEEIMLIDPNTGITSSLATIDINWVMQGAGFSVDSDNHKAYFYGQKDGELSWRLYTVDLITGTTSYVSIDDVGQGGFDFDTY
ncbi:DUF4394 domain-containing protein [Thioflexithrix psekupsensis]|uniref:Uncharacterized protein n=1 Tax=Thioflexithrix psekupsensis TaxID=1570016 RepID=A0A251X9V7_9GAMM|nr:DUF4394 domain-containing protein [Thioflexithrix psekupsensis]OUD14507.1 hypothetical protein TPSD3_09425 [Thioflexithrix psekupsensis]